MPRIVGFHSKKEQMSGYCILTQKIPIHDTLFVTIVTAEAQRPAFHFLKKQYSFVYASVQFDLFFSNTAWY